MRNQETGILCYAGLDKAALWRQAKQYYSQDEGFDRFTAFMPLFPMELVQNMRYVGRTSFSNLVSRNGFSIDPAEYHRQLYAEMPDLYVGENRQRLFDYENHFLGRAVVTVDQAWADRFPQYEPFMGERLHVYMIGGGGQAVAVPESVYPRGCGVLHSAEMDMRIAARGDHYAAYVQQRVGRGEDYDPLVFGREYLREAMLEPVLFTQKEMARVMQDMSLVRSLQEDAPQADGHFSEFSRRGENLPQYAPYHVACDTFERMPITRGTARLMQLHYSGDDHISDLWLSYQDAGEYIDRQNMTLDVRALCQGYQIPPRYAPETLGGRYPDQVRLVTVRDRSLQPMVANTINNPAYGSGMNPLGMINKLILLEDSAELIRVDRLSLENSPLTCVNLTLPQADYVRMLEKAALQENKGMLIDTMYRREAVLEQLREGTDAYRRAKELLEKQLKMHQEKIAREDLRGGKAQLSGYDADIDYLTRQEMSKQPPSEEDDQPPLVFTPDALRMLSIESGCTMRGEIRRYAFEELAVPVQEEDEPLAEQPEESAEEPEELPPEEPAQEEVLEVESPGEEKEEMPEETPEESAPEEPSEEESVPEESQEISAQDKLSLLMKEEKHGRKKEKNLWSRALPKMEQLSLFETVDPAPEAPRLSMKELTPEEAEQGPSLMSRLLPPKDEE